jgi:hypothetical protein
LCREYQSVIYDRYGNRDVYSGVSCRTQTTWTEVTYRDVSFQPARSERRSRGYECRVFNGRGVTFTGRASDPDTALDRAFDACYDAGSRICEESHRGSCYRR